MPPLAAFARGVDVRETYLFDALYAEQDVFRDWTVAARRASMLHRHKLISYFTPGGATESLNTMLRAEIEHAGVPCALESQEGLFRDMSSPMFRQSSSEPNSGIRMSRGRTMLCATAYSRRHCRGTCARHGSGAPAPVPRAKAVKVSGQRGRNLRWGC